MIVKHKQEIKEKKKTKAKISKTTKKNKNKNKIAYSTTRNLRMPSLLSLNLD